MSEPEKVPGEPAGIFTKQDDRSNIGVFGEHNYKFQNLKGKPFRSDENFHFNIFAIFQRATHIIFKHIMRI